MFERGNVQIDAGKIFDHYRLRQASLKAGQRLDVTKALPARVDRGIRAAVLGHQCDELIVLARVAVRAAQRARVPLSAASAAAEIPAALDAAHFRKGRPGRADG